MAKIPVLAILPPVIFAGLAGLFLGGMYRDDPDALPSTLVGQPAPTADVQPLGTLPVFGADDLAADGVKLVNYWASWCAPCRIEHPNLMALAEEGIPIYGISYKDDPAKALDFLAELGDPYAAIGADPEGRTAIDWGVYGVPETYVVDGDGKVVLRFAGPVTDVIMRTRIRPAIEAAQR